LSLMYLIRIISGAFLVPAGYKEMDRQEPVNHYFLAIVFYLLLAALVQYPVKA
jgi:hypothetical protein